MASVDLAIRRALKLGLASCADALGALGALRRARRLLRGPAVHVFGWHVIVDDTAGEACIMPPLCVSRRSLATQLDHLARHYHVWPLGRAADALADGRLPRDRDVAVLTFDDGYKSVLEHAAPLLVERGLPATVFVTTAAADTGAPLLHDRLYTLLRKARRARLRLLGLPVASAPTWPLAAADAALQGGDVLCATDAILSAVPRACAEEIAAHLGDRLGEPTRAEVPPTLRWDEIAELHRLGFDVGAHTVSHAHLPLEGDASLQRELEEPRRVLCERLGAPPAAIAYPSGRYDRRVVLSARRAGYRVGVTTEDRECRIGDSPMRLGRKVITEGHSRIDGRISEALVAAQLDGLFRSLGATRLERGDTLPEEAWIA